MFCFKDFVLSRRGDINDGPLLLALMDIRDSPETQQGKVIITFAQRNWETNDVDEKQLKKPKNALNDIMKMLQSTYSGLPIKLWSLCTQCRKKIALWEDQNHPSAKC